MNHDQFAKTATTHNRDCLECGLKIHNSYFSDHLENKHNLSVEQYYHKYVTFNPLCEMCGTLIKRWSGRLNTGYYITCSNECRKEHTSMVNRRQWQDSDYRKSMLQSINSFDSAVSKISNYYTKLGFDKIRFYLVKVSDEIIKFGITSNDVKSRFVKHGLSRFVDREDFIILQTDFISTLEAVKIEQHLKYNLGLEIPKVKLASNLDNLGEFIKVTDLELVLNFVKSRLETLNVK